MAEIKISYSLELDSREAKSLKKLLGNVSTESLIELGLDESERQNLHEIYDLIPIEYED